MTIPRSFASFDSASVLGPGISSASWKYLWSSTWQKYCDRKSSCRQTICAPRSAASAVRVSALARFSRGSAEQRICTRPRVTLWTGDDMQGGGYFALCAGTAMIGKDFRDARLLDHVRRDNRHAFQCDAFDRLARLAVGARA